MPKAEQLGSGRAVRLAASAARLARATAEPRLASLTPRATAVEKLQAICETVTRLVDEFGARLDSAWSRRVASLEEQLLDAAEYVELLSSAARPEIAEVEVKRLDALADDLLEVLVSVSGELQLHVGRESATSSRNSAKYALVARAYKDDSARERKSAAAFFVSAAVLIILAISFSLWGLVRVGRVPPLTPGGGWAGFSMYLAVSLVCLGAAAVVVSQGERHRRAAQEATRLERQFEIVESYLEPMAPPVRDLVRTSLTPRLFARTLWDDDPLREPLWPSAQDIVRAEAERRRMLSSGATKE